MTKEGLAEDYARRVCCKDWCETGCKDVNECTMNDCDPAMKVRNAYLDGFINGERSVRDRLIQIVQPPRDVDSIYLDIICLIGDIE